MSAARDAETFREVYGTAPAGVWSAPGRVNVIGEHTDYNDGFVLPFALPHATRVAVAPRTDGLLRFHSGGASGGTVEVRGDALRPGAVDGWAAYPAGVLWALPEAVRAGADLYVESTVPIGAGLSSSAALEVACATAFNDLYDLGREPAELARLCQRAENDFVAMPCGIMDQMASACCTAGHALHLDTRNLSARQVPLDMAAAGLRLLVVDTRVKHAHAGGEYAQRRAGCESAAAVLGVTALREVAYPALPGALTRLADAGHPELVPLVRHVVTENRRVERTVERLAAGEPRAVGPILTAGHASLRDDFVISCPELDLAVSSALEAGALGARMTGGGFGGSAIVLVEEAEAARVGEAVTAAFAAAGYQDPRLFEAVPSAGARRLR